MHLSVARATAILNTEGRLAVSKFLMQRLSNSFIIVMNLRGSRTTSFLGSSQNNILNLSQLSLYSQASSTKSAGSGRGHMSGHGYLTSKRTATMTQSKPENKVLLSQARSRRRQEKATGSQRSLREDDDSASTNSHDGGGELESYLKSFEKPNQTRAKKKPSKGKSLLPRGSELDWAKLMESEHTQLDGTPHDEYEFSDHSDSHSDNSAGEFLKKSRKLSNAQGDDADLHAQAQTRVRKTSAISPEIKCIDENSSPNISDLVITDSLNSSSTSSSLSVQVACHPRQAVQSKTRHSEPMGMSRLGDLEKVSDKVEKNGRNGSRPLHKSSVDTKGNNGTRSQEYLSNKSVSVLEEHSVSELSDFKRNILSSINQFEADIDIDNLHEHSDTTSTFEQNIYDVHSLGELEELEHEHSHTVKGEKFDENEAHSSKKSILKSQGSFSTREKSPNRNSPLEKLRPSGFKFSAATTTVKTSPAKKDQDKPATYSSDDFESESIISEVTESMGDSVDEEIIQEEEQSIDVSYNGEELKVDSSWRVESAAESHDMTEETVKDASSVSDLSVGKDKSEPSYSSFSETEQKNMSELTESQQMDRLASDVHPHSSNNKLTYSSAAASTNFHDASVQTELQTTFGSGLPSGQLPLPVGYPSVTVGQHYGKEYLDPSPILPHVISPDALEAVTCYTPSVVALTDMLRTQLSITRSLVARSRQQAASVSESLSADYHYTTLEETKQYIARHRPRLLQFDEASKLVQLEQ